MRIIRRSDGIGWLTAGLVTALIAFSTHFAAAAAFGQSSSIRGTVSDERGAAIIGADVQLLSRDGFSLFTRSVEDGQFEFRNLKPGSYLIEAVAPGFAVTTTEEIQLVRGQSATRNVTLTVKNVNENVVVIATGTPQRTDEVAKAVTVLEGREIEARREITVAEALRATPGLRVQQQGSYGALTTLRFRGQRNFDTSLFLDGMRIRDASDIGGSAVSFIADLLPVGLDRIEILRGSSSSNYGTNAIGGVVNLVPLTGAGRSTFEAGFEAGGLGLYRTLLRGSGGITDRFGYSFAVHRLDVRRGIDGNDEYGNTAGNARVQYNPRPSITISANFYGTASNARRNESPVALPAAFSSTQKYPRAVEGVTFHPDFNDPDLGRRNRVLIGSVRLAQKISESLSYSVAYQRLETRRRFYDGPAIDPAFAAFSPFGDFESFFINNGLTDTLDARLNLRIGRWSLLTAGIEGEREELFQQSTFTPEATTDTQRTFALYGQEQILLLDDTLQIAVAGRVQFYRIRAQDRPGFLGNIEPKSSVTGDGSVAYFIRASGTRLRAHVGNGFRGPSLFERFGEGTLNGVFVRFGDPTLRAEQSISASAGFDQRAWSDRILFGATYFYTRLQRVIDFAFPDPLGIRFFGGYLNRPGGFSRGLETYFEAAPIRGMNARAFYTFTNSDRALTLGGLEQEFVTPRHLFGLSGTQRYRRMIFSLDVSHNGSYLAPVFESDFPFRTAVLRFDSFTKVDFFTTFDWPVSERLTFRLFGGVDNLFNAKYFENGFRAAGAVGRAGVNIKF